MLCVDEKSQIQALDRTQPGVTSLTLANPARAPWQMFSFVVEHIFVGAPLGQPGCFGYNGCLCPGAHIQLTME